MSNTGQPFSSVIKSTYEPKGNPSISGATEVVHKVPEVQMCVIVRALSMMLGRMYLVGFDCVEPTSGVWWVIIDTKLIRAAEVLENPLLNTPIV